MRVGLIPTWRGWGHALLVWTVAALGVATVACSDSLEEPENQDDPWGVDELDGQIEAPEDVDFGEVPSGDDTSKPLAVDNVGEGMLEIRGWTVEGDFEFEAPPASVDEPIEIEPGESLEFEIRLAEDSTVDMEESQAMEGAVVIDSDDRHTPEFRVDVAAQILVPCLEIDTDGTHDFGDVERGALAMEVVDIDNCDHEAAVEVKIDEVAGDDAFSAYLNELFGESEMTLEPEESTQLWLTFEAQTQEPKEAMVVLASNDGEADETAIELEGRGTPYECVNPVIEAEAGDETASSNGDAVLNAPVLEEVSLDASASYDPTDGNLESVQWTLIDVPEDSTALLEDDADSMTNALYLDLAGTYVVELDAVNDEGEWACEPVRLTIEALVGSDIHVQLVWDTPGDPNRHNDHGTDLDLHFLHPEGRWGEAPWDCNWQNPEPQWEDDAETYGNPTLDVDATQGWGPENVNLDDPNPELDYSVGVKYFTDRGYGPSIATIRIFFEGQLHTEVDSPPFHIHEFWDALRVRWSPQEVEVVDEIYDGLPE